MEKLKPNFSCHKRNFYFLGLTVVSQGLRVVQPRLDIQTKAGSQTKEMKVPLKA